MTNSPLHLMLRTFKLQISRNFSYCCGLNELMPSAVALTFIWRGKFWATCNRIVQLDDEQNDNDRLMWQKIEWGKFANENSEANKVHSPLFRYDDGFHYYYFMAGNHNCSYAGVLHHAYKCREEKKKNAFNVPWMGGCFCRDRCMRLAQFLVTCVPSREPQRVHWTISQEKTTWLQSGFGTHRFAFTLLVHKTVAISLLHVFFLLLFGWFPSTRSAWEMIDRSTINGESVRLYSNCTLRRFGVVALTCALAKKKVLTQWTQCCWWTWS